MNKKNYLYLIAVLFFSMPPLPSLALEAGETGGKVKRELLLFEEIPMVTVASKRPQSAASISIPVIVIDEEEIRLSGARNIPDLLRRAVGVDVLSISATDHNVSFRGFNQDSSDKVLVMIDGRSIYLDFYGIVLWDAMPISLEEIKRIELVRGPGSSIYGGNAFNGVINIISKAPDEIDGNLVSVRGGEGEAFEGTLVHARDNGDVSYKLAFSHDELNEWHEDARRYSTSGNFLVERVLTGGRRLLFSGSIDESRGESMNVLDNFIRETVQSHLMLDYQGRDELNFKLFWNGLDTTVTGERALPYYESVAILNEHRYDIDTDTYEAELTKLFKTERAGSLLVGAHCSINRLDSYMMGGSHRQEVHGLFVEDEYMVNSKVSLTTGGRYDHHPLAGGNFSPRAGLVYSPAEEHNFRLSYTTAYGLPTFVQSYLYVKRNGPPDIVGNKDLDVERIRSWNLGYSGRFAERHEVMADLFYNEMEDFIRFPANTNPLLPDPDYTYRNRESYRTYGAEISLKSRLTRGVEAVLNYAYLNIEYVDGPLDGEKFRESPDSKMDAGFNYEGEIIFGSLFIHHVGETRWPLFETSETAAFYDYTEKLDAYTMVNASLGYNLGEDMEISVSGFNILDDRHKEYPMGDKTGRRLTGKLKYRF